MIHSNGNTFSGNIVVDTDAGTLKLAGNAYVVGTPRQGATLRGMTSANTITVRRGAYLYIDDNVAAAAGVAARATRVQSTVGRERCSACPRALARASAALNVCHRFQAHSNTPSA